MPLLVQMTGQGWTVEVRGRLSEPPAFVGVGEAVSRIAGAASLQVFPSSGSIGPVADAAMSHRPVLYENTNYDIYFSRGPDFDLEVSLPATACLHRDADGVAHYTLNFRNDVGFFDIEVAGSSTARATLEVFPTKLDYRSDYVAMRDEVAAIARNLVMTVQAKTYSLASPAPDAAPTMAEWASLLRSYFGPMMRLGNAIVASPHTLLKRNIELVRLEKARRLDRESFRRLMRKQVRRAEGVTATGIPIPKNVPQLSRGTSHDTPENRHIKFVLSSLAFRLQQMARTSQTGDEDADQTAESRFFQYFQPIARDMLRDVERLLQNSFLRGIRSEPLFSGTSQVLQKHPTYSAFVRAARLLSGGLSVSGGVLTIGVKHIAELYEYWCFLKLVSLLRLRFELTQLSFVKRRNTGVVIVLQKGQSAAVRFRSGTGKRLDVVYNRTFSDLPTLAQKPDNVIQLTSERTLHILDAKYRIAADPKYLEVFDSPGPVTDDVNTMHRYRDAIVLPKAVGGPGYDRGVVKDAVVLFPYHNEEEFRYHRLYKSIGEVHVGGIPLLPNSTSLLEQHLTQLLQSDGVIANADGQNQS